MYTSRTATTCCTKTAGRTAAQAIKALNGIPQQAILVSLRPGFISVQQQSWTASKRHFSSTPTTHMKEFFPERETEKVRKTPAAWDHPM